MEQVASSKIARSNFEFSVMTADAMKIFNAL